MPSPQSAASPHTHGRSEVWERPALTAAIRKSCRTLGARIRALRVEHELNQENAAEQIGIHPKHLQRVELGTANVTFATLVAIAIAFRVPVAALFEPTEAEAPPQRKSAAPKRALTTKTAKTTKRKTRAALPNA